MAVSKADEAYMNQAAAIRLRAEIADSRGKVAELERDLAEQCRLLGMSGEREAKHLAQIERLEREAAKRESSVRYLNTNAHLEAQLAVLREFAEEVMRSGDTRLASMAIAVLNASGA